MDAWMYLNKVEPTMAMTRPHPMVQEMNSQESHERSTAAAITAVINKQASVVNTAETANKRKREDDNDRGAGKEQQKRPKPVRVRGRDEGNNNRDDEDVKMSTSGDDDAISETGSGNVVAPTNKNRKKTVTASAAFNRLLEMQDKVPLCVIGDHESSMFPKKLRFMDRTIDVIYDSRVHMWLKADDFAKALGYKNYKSAIERYVHPSFVRTFPEVLDKSRARYGDAFRLYPVTSKSLFINEAGMTQLLLRNMITGETASKEDAAGDSGEQDVGHHAYTKHHAKPKLSAEWINYQIMPSLIAFAEATEIGQTTKECACQNNEGKQL